MSRWAWVALCAAAGLVRAQGPHDAPLPETVAIGASLFHSHCASCHRTGGEPGVGPDLTLTRLTEARLFRAIREGIPGTQMPAFSLPENEIWRIIGFLWSRRTVTGDTGELGPASRVSVDVPYERLLHAAGEPHNWLTYSGSYMSQRHSSLDRINRQNVADVRLKWVHQLGASGKVESTPLVVDGVMFLTSPPSDVLALDAATGEEIWAYRRKTLDGVPVCCGRVNRGVAILGGRLFLGALDGYMLALDAASGRVLWEVNVAEIGQGYSLTSAPLAIGGKIITGVAGGEYGVRGFLDAYDPETGRRLWRTWTIPGPGEPGNDTWEGDSWKTGGGTTWVTGSYDPELNLIYWGTGNPAPDWNGDVRKGDNLYASSVLALDADTGKLRWHFQFIPHDTHDWDAVQIPVLVDTEWKGEPRKLIYWGHRNGFFYVLDRVTGKFLASAELGKQTWAKGLDASGRPIVLPATEPTPEGNVVWPGVQGVTNWYSPSYSPQTGLFYYAAWENPSRYVKAEASYTPGQRFNGGSPRRVPGEPRRGFIRALNPKTGERVWEFTLENQPQAGVMSTAGGLVFGGDEDGRFFALDEETGRQLWSASTGGRIAASPITYLIGDKQFVTIAAGAAVFTFGEP